MLLSSVVQEVTRNVLAACLSGKPSWLPGLCGEHRVSFMWTTESSKIHIFGLEDVHPGIYLGPCRGVGEPNFEKLCEKRTYVNQLYSIDKQRTARFHLRCCSVLFCAWGWEICPCADPRCLISARSQPGMAWLWLFRNKHNKHKGGLPADNLPFTSNPWHFLWSGHNDNCKKPASNAQGLAALKM